MNEIATKEDVQNFRVGSLLDPNYFGRVVAIADVMASSSLIPETLRTEGSGDDKKALSPEAVRANCFLVTNQALKWSADPFAVAAASSVVHGRLMYEGKLVAAILDANLGIKLDYLFGKWDPKTESCIVGEPGEGDLLAVRVIEIKAYDTDGNPIHGKRYIDGCVFHWKTTKTGSPWRPGNMRKMLCYRGAREFSRIHEPGIMVGIVTDDEDWSGPTIEGEVNRGNAQPSAASVMERIRASKAAAADGFDNSRVQTDINPKENSTGNAAGGGDATDYATGGDGEDSVVHEETESSAETSGAETSGRDAGTKADEEAPKPSSAAEPKDKARKVKDKQAESEERGDGPEWLQNVTKMLWAATHFGKAGDVLKSQRKMAAEAYPADGIPEKFLAKARSVFDRCMDVANGSLEPDDALDLVSGLSGVLEEDLRKIDADKGRG